MRLVAFRREGLSLLFERSVTGHNRIPFLLVFIGPIYLCQIQFSQVMYRFCLQVLAVYCCLMRHPMYVPSTRKN